MAENSRNATRSASVPALPKSADSRGRHRREAYGLQYGHYLDQ